MPTYIPNTNADEQEMLKAIGAQNTMQLFADVPAELLKQELNLPNGKSELELKRAMSAIASKNKVYDVVFRGAGAYRHYIPSIVKQIAGKESFVTAYTPYQAEISQGVLQIIFEFQSEICELTQMDVSNASVYDGASAAAEAAAMCRDRKRSVTLAAQSANPNTLSVMQTYSNSANKPFITVPIKDGTIDLDALSAALTEDVASFYVQSPNYYGHIEDVEKIARLCHEKGVKLIYGCNPITLAVLKTPGQAGADIAVGEAQSLGLPLAFGGPYLGFMACKKELMRKLPGRIVGQTQDADSKRCFVLTLQAREQHIRREKAASSICSNQALCALTATVYLAAMGAQGLRTAAQQSASKAHYLAQKLEEAGFKRIGNKEFFHEFLTELPVGAELLQQELDKENMLGGLPLRLNGSDKENAVLWCCTELIQKADMDKLVAICARLAKGGA